MTVKSNTLPLSRVSIDQRGNKTTVTLWDGTYTETAGPEGETVFTYDIYQKTLRARKDFVEIITSNFNIWYTKFKAEEYEEYANSLRAKRNELLAATDWTQVPDAPLTVDQKADMQVYRQALRDIPEQDGFPYDVNWPVMPEKK
jgi:hypothetical protein